MNLLIWFSFPGYFNFQSILWKKNSQKLFTPAFFLAQFSEYFEFFTNSNHKQLLNKSEKSTIFSSLSCVLFFS